MNNKSNEHLIIGTKASITVIAISLLFVSFFEPQQFITSISFFMMVAVPVQLLIASLWQCKMPEFAAKRKQPIRGMLFMLFTVAAVLVIGPVLYLLPGRAIWPPTPMLMMFTILSVCVAFWVMIIWNAWPLTLFIRHPLILGVVSLLLIYAVAYVLFTLLFDFRFMAGAGVYIEALDPKGLFDAWGILVYMVTTIGILQLLANFDLWPFSRNPILMQQPFLGIVLSVTCLVLSALLQLFCVHVLAMDIVHFMVVVPITFIFGTILLQSMLQRTAFGERKQPIKGLLAASTAWATGYVLYLGYKQVAPLVAGTMSAGAPTYEAEIWIASVLLAVTFPFLIASAEFFEFWPFRKRGVSIELSS